MAKSPEPTCGGGIDCSNLCKSLDLNEIECESFKTSMSTGQIPSAKNGSVSSSGDSIATCQNVCNADKSGRCYAACFQAVPKVKLCLDDTRSATDSCDEDKSGDMQKVNADLAIGGQVIAGMQASQQVACSKLGQLLPLVSAGIAAFQGYCSKGYFSCRSSCSDAYELQREMSIKGLSAVSNYINSNITDAKKDCTELQRTLTSAAQNATVALTSLFNTQQCQDGSQDLIGNFCRQNPSSSICGQQQVAVDCNDANYAYSNTVCICQRNPRDSRCGNNVAGGVMQSSSGAGAGGKDGSPTNPAAGLDPGGMGVDPFSDVTPGQAKNGGMANLPVGGPGRQGGGISGGGTGSGQQGAQGAAGGSNLNTKVLGGYMGGNGGGYGGGSYSGRSGDDNGGGGNSRFGGGPNVNLNAFRPPGGMDPKRNLAGVTGPDGLTGPNSNNWEKVNIRYGNKKGTFHP